MVALSSVLSLDICEVIEMIYTNEKEAFLETWGIGVFPSKVYKVSAKGFQSVYTTSLAPVFCCIEDLEGQDAKVISVTTISRKEDGRK